MNRGAVAGVAADVRFGSKADIAARPRIGMSAIIMDPARLQQADLDPVLSSQLLTYIRLLDAA